MDYYSSKYGFDARDADAQAFHKQRRMFVIKDSILHLAQPQSLDSHASWFESLGWMNQHDDRLMEALTRGYVDSTGIYAYTGYDFRTTEAVESELLQHLKELVDQLSLNPDTQVFLGLQSPTKINSPWVPRKTLGSVKTLIAIAPSS